MRVPVREVPPLEACKATRAPTSVHFPCERCLEVPFSASGYPHPFLRPVADAAHVFECLICDTRWMRMSRDGGFLWQRDT